MKNIGGSQYTLKIKALLDASEVQKELARLRAAASVSPAGSGAGCTSAVTNLTRELARNTAATQQNTSMLMSAMRSGSLGPGRRRTNPGGTHSNEESVGIGFGIYLIGRTLEDAFEKKSKEVARDTSLGMLVNSGKGLSTALKWYGMSYGMGGRARWFAGRGLAHYAAFQFGGNAISAAQRHYGVGWYNPQTLEEERQGSPSAFQRFLYNTTGFEMFNSGKWKEREDYIAEQGKRTDILTKSQVLYQAQAEKMSSSEVTKEMERLEKVIEENSKYLSFNREALMEEVSAGRTPPSDWVETYQAKDKELAEARGNLAILKQYQKNEPLTGFKSLPFQALSNLGSLGIFTQKNESYAAEIAGKTAEVYGVLKQIEKNTKNRTSSYS